MCASDVHPSVRVQQIYVKFHFQRTYKRTIVRFVAEKRRKKKYKMAVDASWRRTNLPLADSKSGEYLPD